MRSPGKYIIIICDEPQRMERARRLFDESGVQVGISITSNPNELTSLLKEKTPNLILVYLVSGGERYVTYLKNLRKNMAIDHVPIVVYSILPDHTDIQNILNAIGDMPGNDSRLFF